MVTPKPKTIDRSRKQRNGLPVRLESVLGNYLVKDKRRIWDYISANPDIESILQAAPIHIRAVFGADVRLTLESVVDPEGASENAELWIMVGCRDDVDVDQALRRLRSLDNEWTAQLPWPLRGKVNVDVEFV